MKKSNLWNYFISTVVVTFSVGFLSTGLLAFLFISSGLLRTNEPVAWLPLLAFAITAVFISGTLTIISSMHIFKPIQQLIRALEEVALGDFQIRLPENVKGFQIHEVNVNFNKMMKELNSIEMLKSDFIQNVSHEIKTPLASIKGYAYLLTSTPLTPEQQEYAERILKSSQQLSTLTGNILKLSNLENQQITPDRLTFSLDEQLRQAILSMEPLWSAKNLSMDLDLPETSYRGNAELLNQIWMNLLSNAVKFTPAGGTVSIGITENQTQVGVRFCDTGIGMTQEVQAHIFDKFYQGEHNRSIEGNGLGLALVKKILSLCGGAVEVESSPGCGAVFQVWLPK